MNQSLSCGQFRQLWFCWRLAIFADWVLGALSLKRGDECLHHQAQPLWLASCQILLFGEIVLKIVELIMPTIGYDAREVVVNDFPIALTVGGAVVGSPGGVRVVQQEGFVVPGVILAGKQSVERLAIHDVRGGRFDSGKVQDGREEVINRGELALNNARRNR